MVNPDKIPIELKSQKQWVLWKSIDRDGKPTKVPFQTSGTPASSTNPETWGLFTDVIEFQSGYSGIGFVFSEDDHFIGIDLDGCRNPLTNEIAQWAKDVCRMLGSYTEVSPSLTGIKIFATSRFRWQHRKKVELPFEKVSDKQPAIEVYDRGRYFAVTGRPVKGFYDLMPIDDYLDPLADKFGMRESVLQVDGAGVQFETPIMERASKYLAKMEPSISGSSGHAKCFAAACTLVMGFGLTEDEAYELLAREYNPNCQPPWSEKELRHKVRSAGKQPGARNYLRDANPTDWNRIRLPASYKEHAPHPIQHLPQQSAEPVQIPETNLRDASLAYLSSLLSGKENLLPTGLPDLDYAIGGGVSFGEMVIVAARPSHGKSAVALQMVHHLSYKGYPIVVVSEEMSALALGKRSVQFLSDIPESRWKYDSDQVAKEIKEHFDDRAPITILENCGYIDVVCEKIEDAVSRDKCKIAVVDYAQLLQAKGKSRYEQISYVSTRLRQLASKLNIVLIVLAQLSRGIEGRQKFTPVMSDIKETGQFEQDADVIIFGTWPWKNDPALEKEKYVFFVGKNRNRAINEAMVECIFDPERQMMKGRFASVQKYGEFEAYQ
jgi:KaiC/GvpD/RAD55 family RecA-like ATPase